MSCQAGVPKAENDQLRSVLSQKETEMLTLTIERDSLQKRLEKQESEAFEEIQKLTKELTQTRTKFQQREGKDQEQAGYLTDANRELALKVEQLENELGYADEGNKTLMLQRKTLISNKESVQKELDKVLKRSETQITELDRLLREKTMAFDAMKMD